MDITKHLERAREAVRKKNFDFAITLYNQALAIKPGHRDTRLELLKAAGRKFEYKSMPKALRYVAGLPQLLSIALAKALKNSDMMARASQRYLLIDPYNDSVNFALGRSLESLGYLGGASAVYEFVAEYDKQNVTALKKAGFLMYRIKDIPAALELFEKVLAIAPRDPEAEKMRKNLAAESTLATGSYKKAKSSLDLVADKEKAAELQREARIHRDVDELDEEMDRLRKKVESDPGDMRSQRTLGDLLVRKKQYADALDHYKKLLDADPESFDIRSRIGDVELLVLKSKIETIEGRIAEGGNGDLKENLARVRGELVSKEIEEYTWRVEEHPTDLNLWFRLGRSLLRGRQFDKAIEAFQHSVKDPRHKVRSLHMLGKCFRHKDLFDLAVKQFENALEAMGADEGGRSHPVVYDLGEVCEKMGDRQAALTWFSRIYEVDINYKDVARKIESLKE